MASDDIRAERAIAIVIDQFWPALRRLREQLVRRLESELHESCGGS
jgi:hypothetical protein